MRFHSTAGKTVTAHNYATTVRKQIICLIFVVLVLSHVVFLWHLEQQLCKKAELEWCHTSFPNVIKFPSESRGSGSCLPFFCVAHTEVLFIFTFFKFQHEHTGKQTDYKRALATFSLYWQVKHEQEVVLAEKSNCWGVSGPPDLCDQRHVIPHFVMFK